jgi:hypothetical protein
VREAALRWFIAFPTRPQARPIGKALAFEGELSLEALKSMLHWCATFPEDEDALWRLTQLGANLLRSEACEEVLLASEAVAGLALAEEDLSTLRVTQLTTLFILLVNAGGLRTGIGGDRCDALLLAYLRHPSSFLHGDTTLRHAQRPSFVRRTFALVLRGWLDPEADAEGLERLLGWVNMWNEPARTWAYQYVYAAAAVRQ